MLNPSEVFAPLAEDYARYRPGYPTEVLDELVHACGLTPDWVVADLGSGTGNLARLFLEAGHTVLGVEPNREMRKAGERLLAAYPAFRSLDGTAECIPLAAQSADLVTIGQALHWFDPDKARVEFRRVLRGSNWVAVAWNDRLPDATGFFEEYRTLTRTLCDTELLRCAPPLSAGLDCLFDGITPRHASFPHIQHFDLPGLLGRARSSGYIPQPGTPAHRELTTGLATLFNRYQQDGKVAFYYMAQLFVGRLQVQR